MFKLLKEIIQGESGQIDWASLLGGVTTGVLGAVGVATGAKGTLIGGTVTGSGGGIITVKTTSGKLVTIKRKQHRRYHYRGGRGNQMDKMIQMAMLKSMLK
jgi:hypothetical protein